MMRFLPKLFILMTAFFVISGVTTYLTVSYFIKNEESVIVPNLVGEDIIYVLELLTHMGLNTKVKGSEYSSDVPKNNIIFQDPKPGEIIKKGRDVRIIISKGTKTLAMPNLKGLSLQQAQLILDKNGLMEGNLSKSYAADVNEDQIMAQFPASGKEIKRGVSADLLISLGKRPGEFVMPDLTGLYFDEAVLEAEKFHLKIDTIKTVSKKTMAADIILDQDPPPGYHISEDHPVHLEVNRKTLHEQKNSHSGYQKKALFRYRLDPGYLKQHIRIELRAFDSTMVLYDELMKPGTEIWVAVPVYSVSVIFLYKNDELIISEIFD